MTVPAIPKAMASVGVEGVDVRKMESMAEMGEKATAEVRAELHRSEVYLSNWVAEREQRLGDLQASGGMDGSGLAR